MSGGMADILVPESFVKVAEQLVEILEANHEHFAAEMTGPKLVKPDNVIWGIDFRKGREPEYVASPCDCA